jgi:hypothetical protein
MFLFQIHSFVKLKVKIFFYYRKLNGSLVGRELVRLYVVARELAEHNKMWSACEL